MAEIRRRPPLAAEGDEGVFGPGYMDFDEEEGAFKGFGGPGARCLLRPIGGKSGRTGCEGSRTLGDPTSPTGRLPDFFDPAATSSRPEQIDFRDIGKMLAPAAPSAEAAAGCDEPRGKRGGDGPRRGEFRGDGGWSRAAAFSARLVQQQAEEWFIHENEGLENSSMLEAPAPTALATRPPESFDVPTPFPGALTAAARHPRTYSTYRADGNCCCRDEAGRGRGESLRGVPYRARWRDGHLRGRAAAAERLAGLRAVVAGVGAAGAGNAVRFRVPA